MDFDVTFPERPKHTRRDIFIRGFATALVLGGYGSRSGFVLASVPGVTNGETPGLTEGPYWVDGQPNRVDVRSDSTTAVFQAGVPLNLALTVSQLSDTAPYTITPLAGAKVDIWSANAQGVYSDEAVESTAAVNYGRGYQLSDTSGTLRFLTIFPGWYSGRTPHVHIRIRTFDAAGNTTYNFTTQLFFDETATAAIYASNSAYTRTATQDTTNTNDGIFTGSGTNGSPSTEAGDYLLLTMADDGTQVNGTFHFVVDLSDTANADTGTSAGGGGTGGGGTPPSGGTGTTGGGTGTGTGTGTTGGNSGKGKKKGKSTGTKSGKKKK